MTKHWFTMQDPHVLKYDRPGVWVYPRYEDTARKVEPGDRIAIYETSKHRKTGEEGEKAVVALVVVRNITREIERDEDGEEWLRVADVDFIAKDGNCPLKMALSILKPEIRSKNKPNLGSYIRSYGGKVIPIDPEHFEKFGDYFADYESETTKAQNNAVDAFESAIEREGQGFTSKEIRDAIESYAMSEAKRYLEEKGYSQIKDCSKGNPYDFKCMLGGDTYFVEVKGTQTSGDTVLVTANEANHATFNKNRAILFVVSSIEVKRGRNGQPVANGGTRRIISPWEITTGTLEPVVYRYSLPSQNESTID